MGFFRFYADCQVRAARVGWGVVSNVSTVLTYSAFLLAGAFGVVDFGMGSIIAATLLVAFVCLVALPLWHAFRIHEERMAALRTEKDKELADEKARAAKEKAAWEVEREWWSGEASRDRERAERLAALNRALKAGAELESRLRKAASGTSFVVNVDAKEAAVAEWLTSARAAVAAACPHFSGLFESDSGFEAKPAAGAKALADRVARRLARLGELLKQEFANGRGVIRET